MLTEKTILVVPDYFFMFSQKYLMLEIRMSKTIVLKIPISQFLVVHDAMSIHKIKKEILEGIDILWLNLSNFISPQKCMNESMSIVDKACPQKK